MVSKGADSHTSKLSPRIDKSTDWGIMRYVYAALVTAVLIVGCTSSESDAPATTSPPEVVTSTTTASTTTAPTTTVTQPTTATTEAASNVTVLWMEAMADLRFPVAESLSSGFTAQFSKYLSVINRLDPGLFAGAITDVAMTDTSLTYTFDDGTTLLYNNLLVNEGRVADFDRDRLPISGLVSFKSGEPSEAGDVIVTVTVVYHLPDPSFGHTTVLTVEIDNQSDDDVYGWDAELIGSDRRSVDVDTLFNGSYSPGTISDDILVFLGADLSEGGELWINATYNVTVKAPVPAVPPIG